MSMPRPGAATPSMPTTPLGSKVGNIRIVETLGAGGMGVVYAGFDETLRRKVALKAIASRHRLSATARARFVREARMLSQLDHPNICRIHEFIEDGDNEYLVLEFIAGSDLSTAIAEGLEPRKKLQIAHDVAAVLAAAHGEGVIHRDLKPGNVMLTDEGKVKVLDFGLARSESDEPGAARGASAAGPSLIPPRASERDDDETLITLGQSDDATPARAAGSTRATVQESDQGGAEADASVRTRYGLVVGTPQFMSPEQARGEPVTTASDMYSFGLLLQALFTGRSPYPKGLAREEVLERAERAETLPVAGLDRDLARLIERLKSPAPASRPTAVSALEQLEWILGRPKRRIRRLAAAGLLLVAALAGVKYTVDLGRERNLAVMARQVAEQRRDQAEDLIGFMLGDLRRKLEPVGRLEILDDVGEKAMAYFAAVPEEELSDEELLSRSKALTQLGDVRMAQGNLPAAMAAFREALGLARSLADRNPDEDQRQVGLGAAYFWVGYALLKQGELDGALEEFRNYYEVSNRLARKDPDNPDWQLEMAYSHNNIATVLERKGDVQGALGHYEDSVRIRERLVAMDPADPQRESDLASSLSVLGTALEAEGRLVDALPTIEAALKIRQDLVARDPEHTDWQWNLAISHNKAGILELARGEPDRAVEHFRADLELTRALVERDSTNTKWIRSLAVTHGWLARGLLARGEADQAVGHFQRGKAMLGDLVSRETGVQNFDADLARLHLGLCAALLELASPTAALEEASAALALIEPLADRDSASSDILRWLTEGYLLEGTALRALERVEQADRSWHRALAKIGPLARDSRDPRELALWALALLQLDRLTEALPILARLGEIGYREPGFTRLVRAKGIASPPTNN